MLPEIPLAPESEVNKPIEPEFDDPKPDETFVEPPELNEEEPEENKIFPPEPLFPEPTVTYTAPPRPDEASPDPIEIAPECPELEVPVLKTIAPLTPDVPEFIVLISRSPLLALEEYPDIRETLPPVRAVELYNPPDIINSSPPEPLLPEPTVTVTAPPDT